MVVANELEVLHRRWAKLEIEGSADSRSLFYFRAASRSGDISTRRVETWLHRASELHRFVLDVGRLPVRAPTSAGTKGGEQVVVDWLRYQRRHRETLCAYQRERLEVIPLFSWSPRDDAWDDKYETYRAFQENHGRAPRVSAGRGPEHALALWARRQRSRHRRGKLPKHLVDELVRLPGWSWRRCPV